MAEEDHLIIVNRKMCRCHQGNDDFESGITIPDIFRYFNDSIRTSQRFNVNAVLYFNRQLLSFQIGEFSNSEDFAAREFFTNN